MRRRQVGCGTCSTGSRRLITVSMPTAGDAETLAQACHRDLDDVLVVLARAPDPAQERPLRHHRTRAVRRAPRAAPVPGRAGGWRLRRRRSACCRRSTTVWFANMEHDGLGHHAATVRHACYARVSSELRSRSARARRRRQRGDPVVRSCGMAKTTGATPARREREALCDLFLEVGPDAADAVRGVDDA